METRINRPVVIAILLRSVASVLRDTADVLAGAADELTEGIEQFPSLPEDTTSGAPRPD